MASARTINAPGIELREIDRSNYRKQDSSLPNAPVVLVTGLATKGENYYPQWINSRTTFIEKFGQPSTEFEKCFYYGCMEVINRGGVCIACKLPYNNAESNCDGNGNAQFSCCEYEVKELKSIDAGSNQLSDIIQLDSNIKKYIQLKAVNDAAGKMSIEELDNCKTGYVASLRNKLKIVDVSRQRYTCTEFNSVTSTVDVDDTGILSSYVTNDSLGIFPVVTTPINAIFFQKILNSTGSNWEKNIDCYNPVSQLSTVSLYSPYQYRDSVKVDLTELSSYDNCMIPLNSLSSVEDESVSKIASSQFPLINFRDSSHLDPKYLKQIGIVVMRAYADDANSGKVNYEILESHVGSLDKTAKSTVDNSSIFIDNIVNNSSKYINVFSNVDRNLIEQADTFYINNQRAKMLGFHQIECKKTVDVTKSIVNPLTTVLDLCKDPNQVQLDLVIDAGVSNIAQYLTSKSASSDPDNFVWKLQLNGDTSGQTSKWQQVIKKFDDFCHYTRKDCMFIADGLRPFCLIGNQKIVRPSKIGSTVEKDIVPLIKCLAGINSSYSAGYCDWFQQADDQTGDLFWCPPSIKAASIYIYCDTYFHSWDAPAGMTRGIVPNVIDVAFSPSKDDAGKIYQQSWNYAISYPLDGIIMEGQKTFQTSMTALDRVNVRRLLLKLEKQVVRAAKYFLYEGNTEYLRQKFVDTIRPFFEQAVVGNGISEYAIKCDDELNTVDVIENNEMRCKIAIKPIKTIEYIVISFITTSQSASVTEEVKK